MTYALTRSTLCQPTNSHRNAAQSIGNVNTSAISATIIGVVGRQGGGPTTREVGENNFLFVKNKMDFRNKSMYTNIVEGYGSAFSIYGAMMMNSTRRNLKNNDCWCNDPDKNLNPRDRCYPQVQCNDCDVNKSGSCPQNSGSDVLAGVS